MMQTEAKPDRPPGRQGSPWLAALLILLLALVLPCGGLFGGYALARAQGRGAFARWQRLPALPAPARQILAGGTLLSTGGWWLYIRAADGKVYYCPPYESCWVEVASVPEPGPPEPCVPPADFDMPPPPGNALDSFQAQACHPEAAYQVNFAVLEDGSVWKWQHLVSGLSAIALVVLFSACGALLGLAGAGLAGILAWRRQRLSPRKQ